MRGDSMVEHLLSGRARASVTADLAAEFQRGYPIDRLFVLLDSSDKEVAIAGAMIASEVGSLLAPIADRLCSSLDSDIGWVKSDILDALILSGPPYSRKTIQAIDALTDDPDEEIRRRAEAFVSANPGPA